MPAITRSISSFFNDWLNKGWPLPLMVRGARQVGKSWAVRQWAHSALGEGKLLELNLEQRRDLHAIFEHDLRVERIVDELQLLTGFDLRRPNVVLFLDEIQACPSAVTALRYFAEQMPKLHVIAAGSLLDFILDEIGFPVGRVQSVYMHPCSFQEFLGTIGQPGWVNYLQETSFQHPLPEPLHAELLRALRLYFRIGGMPEAVSTYAETKSLAEVSTVHARLVNSYRDDFGTYAKRADWDAITAVYNRLPYLVGGNRIKWARFSDRWKAEKVRRVFSLLEHARLLTRVTMTSAAQLPLESEAKDDIFKCLFLDIGLMQHALGFDWTRLGSTDDLTAIHEGRFAEQFVGQEFAASTQPTRPPQLFYWMRLKPGSDAEVDFVLSRDGQPAPIEVKSGARGTLKSLALYRQEISPSAAFVLSQRNVESADGITWIPLYAASCLARN